MSVLTINRYLILSASIAEGPPIVDGFFEELPDLDGLCEYTAVELNTGRVFENYSEVSGWTEVDRIIFREPS